MCARAAHSGSLSGDPFGVNEEHRAKSIVGRMPIALRLTKKSRPAGTVLRLSLIHI